MYLYAENRCTLCSGPVSSVTAIAFNFSAISDALPFLYRNLDLVSLKTGHTALIISIAGDPRTTDHGKSVFFKSLRYTFSLLPVLIAI